MLGRIFLIILISEIIFCYLLLKKNGIKLSQIRDSFIARRPIEQNNIQFLSKRTNFNLIEKFKNTLTVITFVLFIIMFLSSFIPYGISGESVSGLFLLIHVSFAPIFAVTLALTFLFFANQYKLIINDFNQLFSIFNSGEFDLETGLIKSFIKIIFWLICFFSFTLLLSIILTFFPIWGMEGQSYLILSHSFSGLAISVLVILLLTLILILNKNNYL